jgi:site-specific DNA-methyltransferase (adenine-specific)
MNIEVDKPWLMLGDCLERMTEIPDGSVDMIMCDLPYGIGMMKDKRTRASRWDKVIPFDALWSHYKRVTKPNSAIVLMATQPFTTDLISSNRDQFRYTMVWDKTKGGGFANAKRQPMKSHEDIVVFYSRQPTYNPQMEQRGVPRKKGGGPTSDNFRIGAPTVSFNNLYYPKSIIVASSGSRKEHFHPTQKPLCLIERLVLTYTNAGDVVLDNCFGSATTGVACINLGRKFVGIERDENFFDMGCSRIERAISGKQGSLFHENTHENTEQESLAYAR